MRTHPLLALLAIAVGCSSASQHRVTATVTPNPNMSMSFLVSYSARGGTTARVVSEAGAERLVTPFRPVPLDGNGQIAVLGLAPATVYNHTVEVTFGTETVTSQAISIATAASPPAVTSFQMMITP